MPRFDKLGCAMLSGACMETMLEELKAASWQGAVFMEAIDAAARRHAEADAEPSCKARWKDFIEEPLSGGGRLAHAVIKKVRRGECSVLSEGVPGSLPVSLVGRRRWAACSRSGRCFGAAPREARR